MKITLKSILAAALAFAAVSCQKAAIDEMSGVFNPPVEVQMADAKCEVVAEPQGDFTFLTVKLTGKDEICVKFASKKFFLVPTTYYVNELAGIKAGMFVAGESTVNGKGITFGSINVEGEAVEESETLYNLHIYGVVEIGANERAKIDWTGNIEFEKPAAAAADYLFVDTLGPAAGADGIPVEGSVKHTIALYQNNQPAGGLELITAEGADIAGHYDVMSYAVLPGKAGNGYSMDLSMWGMGIIQGGSYLMVDGAFVAVEEGASIDVTLDTKTGFYSVKTSNGFEYTMDLYVETLDLEIVETTANGITDESNAPVEGFQRFDYILSKNGTVVAAFDLVVAAGGDIAGIYNVASYPHADHIAGNGWGMDLSMWGMGFMCGGCRIADGDAWIWINPGTQITVTANADGSYTFSSVGANLQSSAEGSTPYTSNFKFKGLAK